MKNKSILLGSVCLIALLVAGYFLMRADPVSSPEAIKEEVVSDSKAEPVALKPFSGKESLNYLLGLAQDLECSIEFTDSQASTTVTGTYFTAEGRLRGDFEIPAPNQAVSSMILRDDTLYTWTVIDGEGYGMKVDSLAREQAKARADVPQTNEPVPLDAPVSYTCKPWTAKDESIFELPTQIIFRDYKEIIDRGMEDGTVYEEGVQIPAGSPCDLCNQVPAGEGQDECRARFQCQ